jgi:GT2 family glycosyltransferase
MLVSVIIPTKNRRDLLRETIASVVAQTYPYWEAIIVDDGSNDGTEEMVQNIASTERRVRFVHRDRKPVGAPVCRNIGLALAKGEYVLFLDSDDLLAASCLESRVRALEADSNLMYVVGEAEQFNVIPGDVGVTFGDGTERYDFIRSLCMHYPWQTAGPLWRRRIFNEMGGWDESLEIGQDMDLGVRALAPGFPYQRLHQRDYYYRKNPGGLGMDKEKLEKQASHLQRIERLRELLESRNLLHDKFRTIVAGNYLWVAQNFASAGQFAGAAEAWRNAKRHRLVNKLHYGVGWILLHALKHGYAMVFAPVAALLLPRGCLIHPECSGMSRRFVDISGQYRPVHFPPGAGGCVKNGEFLYWRWVSYPWWRFRLYLNDSKSIGTNNKQKNSQFKKHA